MRTNRNRILSILLTLVLIFGLVPAGAISFSVTAASGLAKGTVIYYEDFDYADNNDKSSVLSTLGWELAQTLRANKVNYSISNGKLLCDSIAGGATGNSYVTVLDDAAMSEVVKGDYTISYKLKYVEADAYTRYSCLVYNYNGFKSYNSVHLRIAGYGNNQVRSAGEWYNYEPTSGTNSMTSTGTSSISYKLFGVQAASATASSNTNYPLVGKEVTVRIAVDIDAGVTVYINNTQVSTTSSNKNLFLSTQAYAQAIAIKTSKGTKAYMDDFMVYVGTGAIPSGITKEDVTYVLPVAEDYGTELEVMSYNTLFNNYTLDTLGDGIVRTDHTYNVVSGWFPDIVGFQERSATNMTSITDKLVADSGYAAADNYRTDTTASGVVTLTPILYKTSRFTLVANSASNNNNAHGALLFQKSYDCTNMSADRKATFQGTKGLAWAVLKDKQTGGYVLALNTHFDLYSENYTNYTPEKAIAARLSNATECINKMDEIFAIYGVIPTVFTGDFNMRLVDQAYKLLDTRFEESIYADSSFTKYEYSMTDIYTSSFGVKPNAPIDHIFYRPEGLTPVSYTICNKSPEMRIASDHLPVLVKFKIEGTPAPECSHSTDIYSSAQNVKLTGKGEIYYTTDNSDPRTSKTRLIYPGIIPVTEDAVIRYCAKLNGVYSPVRRVSLFFGTPLYFTEVIKNGPGGDSYEGFELINVSSIPVDLADFTVWTYYATDATAVKNIAAASVVRNMKMAYSDDELVIPPGAIAYCPLIAETAYLKKEKISSIQSAYIVTLNEDGTEVTYHTDRIAKLVSYDKAGNISPDLILPIDKTARSLGYTDEGTEARRYDYYNATDGAVSNISGSIVFSNGNYSKVYLSFRTDQTVSSAFSVCFLDSTDGGTVTATDGSVSCTAGAYNLLPTSTVNQSIGSFTTGKYTIGYLTDDQQTAFDSLIAKRWKKVTESSKPITNASEFEAMTASGSYYLANDITISASYANKFKGILDGRGYTITTSVPLFTDMSGTVKNLTVEGNIVANATDNGAVAVNVTGNAKLEKVIVNANLSGGAFTGGFIGYGVDGSTINIADCINNGNVSGDRQTGGFIGYTEGTKLYIDNCINNGKITSTSAAGGIVGRFGLDQATKSHICFITNSENHGDVTSSAGRVAGILDYSAGMVTIAGCTNYGNIGYSGKPTNFFAGGIYGVGASDYTADDSTTVEVINSLTISECYNHGNVDGTTSAAGIAARISTAGPTSGYYYTISDCGNTGNITTVDYGSTYGTKGASGIIGYVLGNSASRINRCYNVGNITSTNETNTVLQRPSGIISYTNGTGITIKHCYSAGTVTGIGEYATPYQLYYNKSATGSANISNNHALEASGAVYEANGTQAASYKTFTATQLANGTLRKTINSAAGEIYYYQKTSKQAYPVLGEYGAISRYDLALIESSDYSENGSAVYRVPANTDVESFVSQFATDVWVKDGGASVALEEKLATGFKVSSFDGSKEMIISVIGDLDCNGAISATDCASLKSDIKGFTEFDEVQNLAADLDGNNQVDTFDYIKLKLAVKNA